MTWISRSACASAQKRSERSSSSSSASAASPSLVDIGPARSTSLGIAAGFGFGLALAITAFGHLSGRPLQPRGHARAVAVAGRFPTRDVVPYWIAQLVGGFGAVLVMAIVYSSNVTDSLQTAPGSGIDDWAALVLEIVATALFVMVILTVATDERAAWNGVMAPFLIGLVHLHRGDGRRPCVGRIVQPSSLARSRPLQPGVGRRLDLHRRPARRRSPRRRDLGVHLPPRAADSGSRVRDRAGERAANRDARGRAPALELVPARGEVLVVLHGRPAAAPAPTDRVECAYEGPALVRHPGPASPAVEVGNARAM